MYAGYDPDTKELLIKGLSAKRRNIMPFVRETFRRVLQLLCHHGDLEGAIAYVQKRFGSLLVTQGGANHKDFAITSSIKHHSEYKGTPPLGYRVNQKLPHPLGPGERISYVHYFDRTNPTHNGSNCKGHWLPGNSFDTALPLELMHNHSIDVYKVLEQHKRELRQYFNAVSLGHASQFESLYRETITTVKLDRGCTTCKNYDITFLNYP